MTHGRGCFVWMLVLLFGGSSVVWAEPVDTARSVAELMGISNVKGVETALARSAEFVSGRQAKKGRTLQSGELRDLFELNEKYVALSRFVTIKPDTPAISVALFEQKGRKLAIARDHPYLFFVGMEDLSTYEAADEGTICELFREMGVRDCILSMTPRRLTRLLETKADADHVHAVTDLVGTIPEHRIDGKIARKRDLERLATKEEIASISARIGTVVPVVPAGGGAGESRASASRIAALEKRIHQLESLLAGVVRNGNSLEFNGLNLVIDGGTEAGERGLGNLVIGPNSLDRISGSHNLVVGSGNACSANGAIVSGKNQTISGMYSVALGGEGNRVAADFAFCGGGQENRVDGKLAASVGGRRNHAGGEMAIISGGEKRSVLNRNPHFAK